MDCHHTLSSLLARTSFAKDGPHVQEAMAQREIHNTKMAVAMTQENVKQNAILTVSMVSHVPMVNATMDIPAPSFAELRRPSDTVGKKLSMYKGLLRPYGDYEHSHDEVYVAIIHFVGRVTFDDKATPSDALAFAAVTCLLFRIIGYAELYKKYPEETRNRSDIAAHLIVALNEETVCKVKDHVAQGELRPTFMFLYEILVGEADISSTIISDLLWTYMNKFILTLIGVADNEIKEILSSEVDDWMTYVAGIKGTFTQHAPKLSLTVNGHVSYHDATYKVAGYCQDGLMLTPAGNKIKSNATTVSPVHLFGAFPKFLTHYNVKSRRDTCLGCCFQWSSKDGRLFSCDNPLISCDLNTAKNFVVNADGTVSFEGQQILHDAKRGKILRTGFAPQRCQVYDVHALRGFDLRRCDNLSFLFDVGSPRSITTVESNGIRVQYVLGRMDDYEVDKGGKVVSITHGSTTKRAAVSGTHKFWSVKSAVTGNTSFTLDDGVN